MQLTSITGREVFVVICWLRGSVTIAGVANSSDAAEKLHDEFIAGAPDPAWEKTSGERRNNTWVESHFIDGTI